MGERAALGGVVGVIVSGMAWSGDWTPDSSTTLIFVTLAALTLGAVWLHFRRARPQSRAAAFVAAVTIAATTGVVLGSVLAVLGARVEEPTLLLLAFCFVRGFVSSLGCGTFAYLVLRPAGR